MQHDLPLFFSSLRPARVTTLAVALAVSAGACVSPALAIDRNAEGWSVLEPSVDTRIIFVSSSEGSDHNSGLTPSKPVRTLERAEELVRDGYPDWVLLKRGDTWNEGFGSWALSGRSDDERVLISAYGDGVERPRVLLEDSSFIVGRMNSDVSHIAIVGLAVEGDRQPGDSSIGIRWLSTGEDILIEDCLVSGFKDNLVFQAVNGNYHNIELRRNVIVDSWSTEGHSQGIYVTGGRGVLLEENVFDHNGWSETIPGAEPDTFNQNVYLQTGTTGVVFRGNLTSRAAAAGVQMRSGGHAIDNMIYSNALGLRFGYTSLDWPNESATGSVVGNVVLGGDLSIPDAPGAGVAIWVERAKDALIKNNVVAEMGTGQDPNAFSLVGYASGVVFQGNVAYDYVNQAGYGHAVKSTAVIEGDTVFENNRWFMPGASRLITVRYTDNVSFLSNNIDGIDDQDTAFNVEGSSINYNNWLNQGFVSNDVLETSLEFPNPGRDLDDYARSLGYTDSGEFIEAARGMNRANWDERLTGGAAARWIRTGYFVSE
jgi:hypothetical protein